MESSTKNFHTELVHQIPTCLHEYKDALQGGLYFLAYRGERPTEIPTGDAKSIRLSLPPKGIIVLDELVKQFGSRTKVITAALALVSEQSEFRKVCAKSMRTFDY